LRYIGTKTELRTINIEPNIAYQVDEDLFIGAGLDIQYLEADLNFFMPQGIVPIFGVNTPSANFTNSGSDWGLGWHVGMIYHPFQGNYIGLSYWSQVTHDIEGISSFQYAMPMSTEFSVNSKLPSTVILDVVQYFSPEFLVKASVSRTNWTSVQELRLKNTAIASQIQQLSGNGDVVLSLNYGNSWRYSMGTRYDINKTWSGMASLSYDRTPTNKSEFSARAPDGDITTGAVGVRYNVNDTHGFDLIYAYSFVHDNGINRIDDFVQTIGTTSMRDSTISLLYTMKG
jgi:long-chain fatty acid transport protein